MTSQQLKIEGLDRVEFNNKSWVDHIRYMAKIFSKNCGQVTSDDLRCYADTFCRQPAHPNAWGSVFRGRNWKCIGRKKSTYKSNHAREIKVWRYQENEQRRDR